MDSDRQGPTPERLRQAGEDHESVVLKVEEQLRDGTRRAVESTVTRMLDGAVLDKLMSAKIIGLDLQSAGLQFYSDWYFAGFAGSGVIDPARDIVDGGAMNLEQDFVLNAAGNYRNAVRAIGIVHSLILTDVLLTETKSLEEYGMAIGRKKDKKDARLWATSRFTAALEELDYHYHGKRKTRMQHHGVDGYRPVRMMPEHEAS